MAVGNVVPSMHAPHVVDNTSQTVLGGSRRGGGGDHRGLGMTIRRQIKIGIHREVYGIVDLRGVKTAMPKSLEVHDQHVR